MEKSFEDYLALRKQYNPQEMKGKVIVIQYLGSLQIIGHENSARQSINPSTAEGDVAAVCIRAGAPIPLFLDNLLSETKGTIRVDPATLQLYK